MFKNTLNIKDFSDLSSKNYIFDDVIPAIKFPRLPQFLFHNNQADGDQISIRLRFFTEQSVDPKIKGSITILLTMQCQRCLGPIEWQRKSSIDFLIIDSLSERATSRSPVNIITVDSNGLSIEKIVEDEILSMLPMSLMHNKVALCENNDTLDLFLAITNKSKGNQQKNEPFSELDKLLKTKDKN